LALSLSKRLLAADELGEAAELGELEPEEPAADEPGELSG